MSIVRWGKIEIDFSKDKPAILLRDWIFSGEPEGQDHATDALHYAGLRMLKKEDGQSVIIKEALEGQERWTTLGIGNGAD